MVKESDATIEKIRAQVDQMIKGNEEEREQRKLENERYRKEDERLQRESAARIAKYEAERDKLNKDTRYFPIITLICAIIAAVAAIISPILVVLLTKS